MRTTIPANKLFLSPHNVRRTNAEEDIPGLADMMFEQGQRENLVVSPRPNSRGSYDVDAGGRRWRAIKLNVKLGRWPANHPVDVLVIPREEASEASLTENISKVPMHPADEALGYSMVIESYHRQGITDPAEQRAHLARRFGRTLRYVVERLRLADLAPDIMEALRLGAITLEAAKAYAAYPDRELQAKVFAEQEASKDRGAGNAHSVQSVRAMLAGRVYRRGDRQVRFVGIDAYVAAGGRTVLELFMGHEDEEVLVDTDLVDRLVRLKAEPEARRLAEAAGFAAGGLWGWGPETGAPKTPAGFDMLFNGAAALTDIERPEAILLYRIDEEGQLEPSPHCFRKKVVAQASAEAGSPAAAAGPPGVNQVNGVAHRAVETEVERLGRIRRQKIERRALFLATPPFQGTAFEGCVFWPPEGAPSVEAVQRDADGNYVVALLIKVAAADVEAAMARAERLYDDDEATADAARSAPAADVAELETAGGGGDDRLAQSAGGPQSGVDQHAAA